jgi:hypothetical protein
MDRLYLYCGSLALIGGSLALNAAALLAAGGESLPVLLMLLGGTGMILSSAYRSARTDPTEFSISTAPLFALVGAACLSLAGSVFGVLLAT